MGNIDSQLDQLAHLYGYRLHKFSQEDANDIIALDFQQKSNMMLKQYSKFPFRQYRESGVHMHLRIVERKQISEQKHGLDAWVAPLFVKDKHAFAIYLSIGLVRGISEVFTAMAVGPEKLISGIVSQDMEEHFQNYIYPRITAALTFILLHETAHILRAHIPFYYQDRYVRGRKNARLSFHLIESIEDMEVFMKSARIHRSMEIDADTLAIGLIHEFLSSDDQASFLIYDDQTLRKPEIFGEAIAIVTRLLEQWRRSVSKESYSPNNSVHPHPDIRYIFLTSWLMARRKLKDRDQSFLETTIIFEKGFDAASKKMEVFGDQFFPLFEYLNQTGKDNSLEEYELIRKDLAEYLQPKLSNYVAPF